MMPSQEQTTAAWLYQQWQNPNDIFTILMILGGDVVQQALAQECGTWLVPVSFSFGWVSKRTSLIFADPALTLCRRFRMP